MKQNDMMIINEFDRYYTYLRGLSSHHTCYEITLLNSTMAGIKILLTSGEERIIYYPLPADLRVKGHCENQQQSLPIIIKELLDTSEELISGKLGFKTTSFGEIFVEKIGSGKNLIICGAGHVSIALIRMAKMVGFEVTVIDDRPNFCHNAMEAGADQVVCDSFSAALKKIDDSDAPYFVIVTRGHQYDIDCMHAILNKNHRYIGMMGSKVRVKNLKQGLLDEGFDKALLDSVHMPIGLKIGAMTPEEIAVSIIAEIIHCRRSKAEDYYYTKEMMEHLCQSDSSKVAIATIIVKKGCGPREAGTKMLIHDDGSIVGTIGGGCAEADVIQKARYALRHGQCELAHVDMTGREAAENGLVCGGVMDVFIQPLK